jgi:hypothetical protein
VNYGTFVAWTIIAGLIHLAIAAVILSWCGATFDETIERAPQLESLPAALKSIEPNA